MAGEEACREGVERVSGGQTQSQTMRSAPNDKVYTLPPHQRSGGSKGRKVCMEREVEGARSESGWREIGESGSKECMERVRGESVP